MTKRVLIVGKNSYIGNHIDEWITNSGHQVIQLDVLTDEWKTFDYSPYDTVVHVAGIVHQPNCQDWELYKRVNTDMPIAIAKIAKEQGVGQYIFLSTMGVYGVDKKLSSNVINHHTPLNPTRMYGKSKLMAEEGLRQLQDSSFNVACVRPPSVYGKGCRGGYMSGFVSIARRLPITPSAYKDARQSFIYIDNLCELIKQIVENNLSGVYCPQDDKAVNANELLSIISKAIGTKYRESKVLGFIVKLFPSIPIIKKVYGGVEYDIELSSFEGVNYVVVPLEEGMSRTVQ